jgi:hypothetical protein
MLPGMRVRKCPCGHTRSHPEVAQDAEYTLWGWIQLSMLGITPLPDRIEFRCRRCGKSLGVSRDPSLLRKRATTDVPAGATSTAAEPAAPTAADPTPKDEHEQEPGP